MGVLPFWLPQTRQSEERFFWMIVSVSMGTKPNVVLMARIHTLWSSLLVLTLWTLSC